VGSNPGRRGGKPAEAMLLVSQTVTSSNGSVDVKQLRVLCSYLYGSWGIENPWTFKFIAVILKLLLPTLKFNISTMCHYKSMKYKVSERIIIRVHICIFWNLFSVEGTAFPPYPEF
jgi:hypothetical protein